MAEQYQELNQSDYKTDYEDYRINPPSAYNFDRLPYYDLPPRKFEQLCLKYCYKTYGMERCTLYGYPGQKQYGLDILVRTEEDKYILYQCKRVEQFTGDDLLKAIQVFRKEENQQKWFANTQEFVLFSSNELIDTSFIEMLETQRRAMAAEGITLSKMGSVEISEVIKNDVEIVYEFFGELWVKAFIKKDIYEPYLAKLVKLPEKKVYPEVRDYVARKLINPEKANEKYGYTFYDAQALTAYIAECHAEQKPARVVIRSDAGLGKSKELDYLAFSYSKSGNLFPVIIRLKLYQGNLDKLIGPFFEPWQQVPKAQLLLLFDGLDEVPNDLLEIFLQEFNLFLQAYSAANIVATARSNFSLKSVGDGADGSSQLKPQYLKPLDERDIDQYLADRGLPGMEIKKFKNLCEKTRLNELLNNPFYLKNLVDLFRHPSLAFPDDRAEAISQIIELKLEEDRLKYPAMPTAERYLSFAKKLAIYLTLTGRSSIQAEQLPKFTTLAATDIRYCSLFSRDDNEKILSIYFEHNNFQEYLTAKYLNALGWAHLRQLLFHEPEFAVLKPRLVNTANYLFTILDADGDTYKQFFTTLRDRNAELLLKFEKDKIWLSTRLEIFRHLILEGKKEGLYYLRGRYDVEDLLNFIDHSAEILPFLFAELNDIGTESTHRKCLLELLFNFHTEKITGSNRVKLRKELRGIITSDQSVAVHDMAIDVMTRHLFLDTADINLCVKKCPNRNTKMVREALLKMIGAAGADGYFQYILESVPLLFPKETNSSSQLGNEFLEIVLSMLCAGNADTWLDFATKNINELSQILDSMYDPLERLTIEKINLKLADIYAATKSEALLNGYTAFVAAIHANVSESKWGNLALFFINTNTKDVAFFALLTEDDTVLYRSSIGADLVDKTIIDLLVSRVTAGTVPKDSLRLTRNFLHYFNSTDEYNYLIEKVASTIPDFFQVTAEPVLNWDELNRQRTTRDYELLASKDLFIGEAKMIYEQVGRLRKVEQDWFNLQYSEKAEIKKIVTNNILFRMIEMQKLNDFDAFLEWLGSWNWDYYVFTQLTLYAVDHKKQLPPERLAWLQNYVNDVLWKQIDFKKSIKQDEHGRYVTVNGARQMRTLFMQGIITFSRETMLDMLSFDSSGFVQITPSPVNREYLFQKILASVDDADAVKKRVLLNLRSELPEPRVLETHCSICILLQITGAIPLLVEHLQKRSTSADVKDSLVTTLIKLEAAPEVLVQELKLVRSVKEDWQWLLFNAVVNQILAGSQVADKAACLKLAENSLKKHAGESRIKWRLIKSSLKLGSPAAARNVLNYLNENNSWHDYADIEAKDFEAISSFRPKKMIDQCITLLGPAILDNGRERHNSVERFLTQLVRQLAVKEYSLMVYAVKRYEQLITGLIAKRPELVHLRWYEKDLVSDYYMQAGTFEDEKNVLQMIGPVS
jgi:hypothetical protein